MMFEPVSWVLTVILMYQPVIHIEVTEIRHATLEQCMAQREVILDAWADNDPATHLSVGCTPEVTR